ncbi:MAG: DinB family protein [Candidatus Kapaibacterium sp.]
MALTLQSRQGNDRSPDDLLLSGEPFGLPAFTLDGQGSGGILAEFVENLGPVTLEDIPELKRRYAALIIQLDRLRSALEAADMFLRPKEGGWTMREMLGHLIDADRDIWWPRIEALLREEVSPIPGNRAMLPHFADVDSYEITQSHHWNSQPIEEIFSQLMRARWDYAMKLNAIPSAEFNRCGEHAVLGELCLLRIVQILVAHDEYYLANIRGMIGKATVPVSWNGKA